MGQDMTSCCGARLSNNESVDRNSSTPKLENKKEESTNTDEENELEIHQDVEDTKNDEIEVKDSKQDTKRETIIEEKIQSPKEEEILICAICHEPIRDRKHLYKIRNRCFHLDCVN